MYLSGMWEPENRNWVVLKNVHRAEDVSSEVAPTCLVPVRPWVPSSTLK
jgi:hypothetical protein